MDSKELAGARLRAERPAPAMHHGDEPHRLLVLEAAVTLK